MRASESGGRWQRLNPAMLLFSVGPLLRRLLVPLLVGGAATAQDPRSFRWFVYTASLFSIGALFSRFLTYRYSVGRDAIEIQQGLFVKRSQRISVQRIGLVDSEQGVLARRLGVVKLTIRTEGGSATEAVLPALSLIAAEQIRDLVRSAKRAKSAAGPGASAPAPRSRPPARRVPEPPRPRRRASPPSSRRPFRSTRSPAATSSSRARLPLVSASW